MGKRSLRVCRGEELSVHDNYLNRGVGGIFYKDPRWWFFLFFCEEMRCGERREGKKEKGKGREGAREMSQIL